MEAAIFLGHGTATIIWIGDTIAPRTNLNSIPIVWILGYFGYNLAKRISYDDYLVVTILITNGVLALGTFLVNVNIDL